MLLGMVVDTSGLVPRPDSLVFDSLGRRITGLFANPVIAINNSTNKITEISNTSPILVNQVVIQEEISKGENIRQYAIEAWVNNTWKQIAHGQSVGHKRIQTFAPITTNRLRLIVEKAEGPVNIKRLAFYNSNIHISDL